MLLNLSKFCLHQWNVKKKKAATLKSLARVKLQITSNSFKISNTFSQKQFFFQSWYFHYFLFLFEKWYFSLVWVYIIQNMRSCWKYISALYIPVWKRNGKMYSKMFIWILPTENINVGTFVSKSWATFI